MNLEQQVCSLWLAKKLKELGVKQESLFVWEYFNEKCYGVAFVPFAVVPNPTYSPLEWFSAFTSAELGMMLPDKLDSETVTQKESYFVCEKGHDKWLIAYTSDARLPLKMAVRDKTEADARAKALIRLIEAGLIK